MDLGNIDKVDVLIVGAGLSGLTAAYHIAQQAPKLSIALIEPRERVGGRTYNAPGTPHDVGGAWCWSQYNPHLVALAKKLGVKTFPQPGGGLDTVYQMTRDQVQRVSGARDHDPSQVRFAGGAYRLATRLREELQGREGIHLVLGHAVTAVDTKDKDSVHVHIKPASSTGVDKQAAGHDIQARRVILALPPRLALSTVQWTPPVPTAQARVLQAQPTWMGNTAKVIARYSSRFWHEDHLSGTAMSRTGPLIQLYDASDAADAEPALCGFIFDALSEIASSSPSDIQDLKTRVQQQLVALYGQAAAAPDSITVHNWSRDIYTIPHPADPGPLHHPHAVPAFRQRLGQHQQVLWAGAEAAQESTGLLDGAVLAGQTAGQAVVRDMTS
eukprot:TRINITY_DN5195_c0_g1_i1.p1 TRINITY_DN5195_c0_g1~~TRINITY_DN5195_c0_g1_i1.p1  ORF type:complete len:429 (-),score=71.65 TRINITY_DN5195_c0_g1_i1:411-1565(-)